MKFLVSTGTLKEDSTDPSLRSINFNNKLFVGIRLNEDECLGELVHELEEGIVGFRGPGEQRFSRGEGSQRDCSLPVITDKVIVEMTNPRKFLSCLRV